MMSTKLRSKADAPLPLALTTPFMSQIKTTGPLNGVRGPRIRRRVPSLSTQHPERPTASAPVHHKVHHNVVPAVPKTKPKKPSSAGSTRSTSSAKSSVSVRSTVSAKSSSSTSGRSAASLTQNHNFTSDLNGLVDYDEDQDIKFIDVESSKEERKEDVIPVVPPKQLRDIVPEEILYQAQEADGSRVYQIDLHGSHIGRISNLEKFLHVRVLDLSCNHINTIENLATCKDVRELKLYGNAIQEIKNLDELKELCHLQIQHNRIRSIGKGLSQQRKLQILRLDSNSILKLESRDLTACVHLTSIDLSNNKIDNLTALGCLPNLEELQALNNRLRVTGDLSRCKKLREVDLSHNRLNDISGLKGLPNLKWLHLAHNHLPHMKSLGKVKGLEELNLNFNRLTETSHLISFYPALQILDVSENHIEDWEQICGLGALRELYELYVSGNPFASEKGMKPVYHSDLQREISTLEVLDGATVKRPSSRPTTPLMRPMSAASVVSTRQVENQLKHLETGIMDFESNLSSRFDALRTTMSTLPVEAPSCPGSSRSDGLSTPGSARPTSKSSKRTRLQEARSFAENHF